MSRVKIDTKDYEPVVQLLAKLSTLDDERKSWFLGFAAGMTYGIKRDTTTDRAE